MIPFGEDFEFSRAKWVFGQNRLELPWMLGTDMPSTLPQRIADAMDGKSEGEVGGDNTGLHSG